MVKRLLEWLLVASIGALGLYALAPAAEPVTYRDVIVSDTVILEREPPARPPTIIERIRYVTIEPRQVATAPGGGASDVAEFCRPTVVATTDTVEVPVVDPMLLLRSVSHDPGWFWQRDNLLLTGPTSTGDLRALDYSVRPGFSVRVHGDSALVRYPRTALFRELLEVALPLGIGFGMCHVARGGP